MTYGGPRALVQPVRSMTLAAQHFAFVSICVQTGGRRVAATVSENASIQGTGAGRIGRSTNSRHVSGRSFMCHAVLTARPG